MTDTTTPHAYAPTAHTAIGMCTCGWPAEHPTHQLPDHVAYAALITMLETLLPGFDPTRVSFVGLDHAEVTVNVWNGSSVDSFALPIRHAQGSATEGGQG